MIVLNTLINQLKIKDALLFHGATLTQAQSTSITLVKQGYGRIPRGYLNFLNVTDGLTWHGLELFGCVPHERAGTVFNQPSILDYQTKYAQGHFFAHRLILGRAMETLISYNTDNQCYELIDRNALSSFLKFPRFEDILYQIIF